MSSRLSLKPLSVPNRNVLPDLRQWESLREGDFVYFKNAHITYGNGFRTKYRYYRVNVYTGELVRVYAKTRSPMRIVRRTAGDSARFIHAYNLSAVIPKHLVMDEGL